MGFLFFLPDGENSPYRAEITINKNLMPKSNTQNQELEYVPIAEDKQYYVNSDMGSAAALIVSGFELASMDRSEPFRSTSSSCCGLSRVTRTNPKKVCTNENCKTKIANNTEERAPVTASKIFFSSFLKEAWKACHKEVTSSPEALWLCVCGTMA
jgi:hypothetical protein